MPDQEFLTVQEVCKILKISQGTAYKWIKRGLLKPDIKVNKIMRFDKSKIESLKVGGEDERDKV